MSQEGIAKHAHALFLGIPETQNLIRNLKIKNNQDIKRILQNSVLDSMSDTQIRMLCAKAQAAEEIIERITNDYKIVAEFR